MAEKQALYIDKFVRRELLSSERYTGDLRITGSAVPFVGVPI
jgi:hypothetical protein